MIADITLHGGDVVAIQVLLLVSQLHEVIALARRGLIKPHVQRFPLEEAMHAYELMEQGQLSGRAVMVP